MYVYRNVEARSPNLCCGGKAVNVNIMSEWVRARASVRACVCVYSCLSYPACKAHAVCYIVLCGLSGSIIFFLHYLINVTIFGEKNQLLKAKCVFWVPLQRLSETFFIPRIIQRDIVVNVRTSSCKVPVIFVNFDEPRILSTDFRKIPKYQIPWKSVQWGQSCVRTHTHEASNRFSQFSNAPNK
jgi:hypothetical protein